MVCSLIKDIRWQIKNIEKQQKRLAKMGDKLRSGKKKKEEDICQDIFECEEENKYLGERLTILNQKLQIAENKFQEITST